MSRSPNTFRHRLLIFSALLLLLAGTVTVTWWARGKFDETFLYEGHLHLVNPSPNPIQVEVEFPSGKRLEIELPGYGAKDFKVGQTGEGSIGVTVNGTPLEPVGYVTSHNNPMVLLVGDDRAGFSQLFRSLATPVPKT